MNHRVLTLDASGTPQRWTNWQDTVVLLYKDRIGWSQGEQTIKYGGVSRMTGRVSEVTIPTIISVKDFHSKKHKIPVLNNSLLFARDQHICAYCGKEFKHNQLTRDHIVPVSKGGKNVWNNVVTACKRCNNYKDDNLLEHCGMELLYLPYVPCNCEKLILEGRNILADQMDFLKAFLPEKSRIKLM